MCRRSISWYGILALAGLSGVFPGAAAVGGDQPSADAGTLEGSASFSRRIALGEGDVRENVTVELMYLGVEAHDTAAEAKARWTRELDETNSVRFDHLPAGRYVLEAGTKRNVARDHFSLDEYDSYAPAMWFSPLGLVPRRTLMGRVVDALGDPVANARVFPWGTGRASIGLVSQEYAVTPPASTDEDGRFRIPDLECTWHWIKVTADGYADHVYGPLRADEPETVVALRRGGSVSGRVVARGANTPVADVEVVVRETATHHHQSTITDRDGVFTFPALAAGVYVATVEADDFVSWEGTDFRFSDGAETEAIHLEVRPAARVSGLVYDNQTGAGLEGIEVRAESTEPYLHPRGTWPTRRTKTRDDGTFVLAGLPEGHYHIRSKDDLKPLYRSQQYWLPLTLREGDNVRVDFVPISRRHVSGRVVDVAGEAVAGAQITGLSSEPWGQTHSGLDGTFTIESPRESPFNSLRVYKEGYVIETSGNCDLSRGSHEGVELTLRRVAGVSGVVVDQNGKPLPRAIVSIESGTKPRPLPQRTDENGHFRFGHCDAGTWSLTAGRSYEHLKRIGADEATLIELTEGEQRKGIRLTVDTQGLCSISGKVTVADDIYLGAGGVSAYKKTHDERISVRFDQLGRYHLDGLEPGVYTVEASAPRHTRLRVECVVDGAEELDIALEPAIENPIRGTVIDEHTGMPVKLFYLTSGSTNDPRPRQRGLMRCHDEAGRFEADVQRQKETRVFVRAEGYALAYADVRALGPGEVVDDIVIALAPARPLSGKVVTDTGEPLPGATILVGESLESQGLSVEDGTFVIRDLRPGRHTLHARYRGHEGPNVDVDTTNQDTVEIVLKKHW